MQVMEFLPAAMKRAFAEYHDFMEAQQDGAASKEFTSKQNAGKAAIAHILLLAKLSQWAMNDKKSNENEDFLDFMQAAKKEAGSFEIPDQDLA